MKLKENELEKFKQQNQELTINNKNYETELKQLEKEKNEIMLENNYLNKDLEEINKKIEIYDKENKNNLLVIEKLNKENNSLKNINNNFIKEKDDLLNKIKYLEESEKQFNKKIYSVEKNNNSQIIKDNSDKIFYSTSYNFKPNLEKEKQIITEINQDIFNNSDKNTAKSDIINNKSLTYFYNDNKKLEISNSKNKRNFITNKLNFNYTESLTQNFPNELFLKNSTFTPKASNLNILKNYTNYEEEKCDNNENNNKKRNEYSNNNYKDYISSLNLQIYQLEEQISNLQKKLADINNSNSLEKKNKVKIKEYEEIIQNEKIKNQKAEKIIFDLENEINLLKQEYKKNKKYFNENENDVSDIQQIIERYDMKNNNIKINSEKESLDKFINELRKQAEDLKFSKNSNSNDITINKTKFSENNEKENNSKYFTSDYFKSNLSKSSNSNDIFIKTNINKSENMIKNISDYNKNIIYTIEEEIPTYSLEDNNNNNNNLNNHLYDKMKGSDINFKSNYNSCRNLNSNNKKVMQRTFNLDLNNNNNVSEDIDNNDDINIKINTS